MITSCKIQNFQSHENTLLEFHSGINAIIGKSGSGKTAIIRALNWSLFNRPGGDAFRSFWDTDTMVEVETNEGQKIIRSKTKKENSYSLESEGKKKLDFKAFGQGVPDEISEALNISDINIQLQMDAPFLLSSSAGEVARYLNKITHLDKIDTTLSNITAKVRVHKGEKESEKKRVEQLLSELDKFDHLEKEEELISSSEANLVLLSETELKKDALENLLIDWEREEERLQEFPDISAWEKKLLKLENLFSQYKETNSKANAVQSLLSSLQSLSSSIPVFEAVIVRESAVKKLERLSIELEKIEEREELLLDLKDSLERFETEIKQQESVIRKTKEKIKEIVPKGMCPLCSGTGRIEFE